MYEDELEEEKFSLDDIEEVKRVPKETRADIVAKITEKYQTEKSPNKLTWPEIHKTLFPGQPRIYTEGVTQLTQPEVLDNSDIFDAIMGQQPIESKRKKYIISTPLNPQANILPKKLSQAPTNLLNLPENDENPAVLDTLFMDAYRYNKNYEDIDIAGPRVSSHKQERINEQYRNLARKHAGTYVPQPRPIVSVSKTTIPLNKILDSYDIFNPIKNEIPEKKIKQTVQIDEPFNIKKEFSKHQQEVKDREEFYMEESKKIKSKSLRGPTQNQIVASILLDTPQKLYKAKRKGKWIMVSRFDLTPSEQIYYNVY